MMPDRVSAYERAIEQCQKFLIDQSNSKYEDLPPLEGHISFNDYREACFKLSQDITLAQEAEQLRKERDELARELEIYKSDDYNRQMNGD